MLKHQKPIRPALAGFVLALLFAFSAPATAHDGKGMGDGHPTCPGYGTSYGKHPHGHGGHGKPYHAAPMSPGRTLGVMITGLPHATLDELGVEYGVRVVRVLPGSPAETAGIQPNDIILELDNKPVYTGDRLRWLVRKGDEGQRVTIKLQRDKNVMSLDAAPVSPAPKPKPEERPAEAGST
ncbi:MAG: PDZ domain-containing protein [Thiobacillus sp.]